MNYLKHTELDLGIQKNLLKNYEMQLQKLPIGKLTCKMTEGHNHYYLNNKQYLGTKDSKFIQELKKRAYLEEATKVMTSNIKLQEKTLAKYKPYDFASINDSLPRAYQSDYKLACKDPTNEFSFGSTPIHQTSFGLYTRSKSEVLIAEMLHSEGIRFTYEEPLDLIDAAGNYITLHPDFTLYLSLNRKFYWEHAGLMTNLDYRANLFKKIELYYNNEITLSTNLIITMDDKNGGFDAVTIKKIINLILG